MAAAQHRARVAKERQPDSGSEILYQLRQYRVASGRLNDETARALACIRSTEEGGLGLFERYGIPRPIGLWKAVCGPHTPCVVFLYRWENAASCAEAFETFYLDAQWNDVRATTNDGSEIVERLDDLLLTGPEVHLPPNDVFYRFSFSRAKEHEIKPVLSLAPLCGEKTDDLKITGYPTLAAAVGAEKQAGDASLICELTHWWAR